MDKKQKSNNKSYQEKDKFFQYDITVALDHGEIGKHPERIKKIKPFINKYNWKWINYPSEKGSWKKLRKIM